MTPRRDRCPRFLGGVGMGKTQIERLLCSVAKGFSKSAAGDVC